MLVSYYGYIKPIDQYWDNRSPDLNPVEHVWDKEKREVREEPLPAYLHNLVDVIVLVWPGIPQEKKIQDYLGSMRARCNAIVAAHCGHTRYCDFDTRG